MIFVYVLKDIAMKKIIYATFHLLSITDKWFPEREIHFKDI